MTTRRKAGRIMHEDMVPSGQIRVRAVESNGLIYISRDDMNKVFDAVGKSFDEAGEMEKVAAVATLRLAFSPQG